MTEDEMNNLKCGDTVFWLDVNIPDISIQKGIITHIKRFHPVAYRPDDNKQFIIQVIDFENNTSTIQKFFNSDYMLMYLSEEEIQKHLRNVINSSIIEAENAIKSAQDDVGYWNKILLDLKVMRGKL